MNQLTDINEKPLSHHQDTDLRKTLDYFLAYINPDKWVKRKQAIENKIGFEKHIQRKKNKKLLWIYCHFIESYSPFDKNWVFDETISSYYEGTTQSDYPLDNKYAILPDDIEAENGAH